MIWKLLFTFSFCKMLLKITMLGSGCGLVGTDVVSHFRGPRIESSHWENFIMNMFSVGKTKIKKKMPETANLKINSRFIVLYLICEVIWAKISGQKGDVLSECKPMGLSYRNQQLYRAFFINLTSPLMAFTGVTNAYGPSLFQQHPGPQLTTSRGSIQA